MEFLGCSLRYDELDNSVHPAHDGWDVDEELFLEQLWVVMGENINRLRHGGLDRRVLPEEADRLVIVHLIDLVRIAV